MPENKLEECLVVFTRFNWSYLIEVFNRNNSSTQEANLDDNGSHMEVQWFSIAISTICMFGIIGNLLNLLVLANHRIISRLDYIGHSVNNGLKALAVSDMLFCVLVFPHSFITTDFVEVVRSTEVYVLYYRIYGVGLINFCLMTSTWLVVIMACSRYWGIHRPLHAREQIWTRHMNILILLVYLCSILVCLPYFISKYIKALCTHQGETWYNRDDLFGETNTFRIHFYLRWIWGIFANFIPTVCLILCNILLVRELSVAYSQRGEVLQTAENKSHRIVTMTIINIIIMSLVLVAPAEILRYIDPVIKWGKTGHTITLVANLLQTVNFAVNFGLYCVVNVHFRTTVKSWFLGATGLQLTCCSNSTALSPSSSMFTRSFKGRKKAANRISLEMQSCQTDCDTFLRQSIKKYPNCKGQSIDYRASLI